MKKHQLLILSLLLPVLNFINAQSCLPQGITFTSQAQIDSFPLNYPGCTVIEGDVRIAESLEGNIVSLDSLYPITTIDGDVDVVINNALTSLSGLDNLTSIGGVLEVLGNDALTSLSGLGNLTFIGGYLFVVGNDALTSLSGLDNLTFFDGSLSVNNNAALTCLSGLDNLTSIGGSLEVLGNDALTSLSGLGNLTSIGGAFSVSFNDALTSLIGLYNLTAIGWRLAVFENDALTNLSGLGNLTTIDGDLYVSYNNALTSLSGLDDLTMISGDIEVLYNNALASLSGLDNFDYTTIDYLEISGNPYLSTCEVQPICDYIESGGSATIEDNAPGCNSQQEVEDACETVSVDDLIPADAIQLFPNPTNEIIQITTPNNTEWNVSIRDAMGRIVIQPHELVNGDVDLSNVPTGLYFVELNNGQHAITKRIIKQ